MGINLTVWGCLSFWCVSVLYWDENHVNSVIGWMLIEENDNTFIQRHTWLAWLYLTCTDPSQWAYRVAVSGGFTKFYIWYMSKFYIRWSLILRLKGLDAIFCFDAIQNVHHTLYVTYWDGFLQGNSCFWLRCTRHKFFLSVQCSNLQTKLWWRCLKLRCRLSSSRKTYFRCVCWPSSQANADKCLV